MINIQNTKSSVEQKLKYYACCSFNSKTEEIYVPNTSNDDNELDTCVYFRESTKFGRVSV